MATKRKPGATPAKRYTREEIYIGLQLLAYHNDAERARKEMEAQGLKPPSANTLYDWRKRHPEIYEQAKTNLDSEALLPKTKHLVHNATDLEIELLERIRGDLRSGALEPKEVSTTLRNVSVTKGIAFDKIAGPIEGRPNVVVEMREPTKLLERMAEIAAAVRPVVEGSVVEVEDAQVIEASD